MNEKILIIEDEKAIARMISLELCREGYECECVHDGEAGLAAALSGGYALALLDVMLPKRDGFSVLEELRRSGSALKVIMLTARGDIDDRVQGLDLGADDYLTKPFSMRELAARVRAALRRQEKTAPEQVLRYGDLKLDRLNGRAFFKEEELNLARKEFEVLAYFMEHRGSVCTREELLKAVWGYDYLGDTNLIDVYIRYLRTKIDHCYGVQYLKTVRGLGYCFGEADE